MASPHIEVFFIYDNAGVPKTGATPTFASYLREDGVNLIGSAPAISEIGGGAYKFTPAYTTNHGIVYVITTGFNPTYIANFLRPEDWNIDNADIPTSTVAVAGITALDTKVTELLQIQKGKWEIKTTGLDANRLIIYQLDGVTVLKKFDLFDKDGLPTSINPFRRDPI